MDESTPIDDAERVLRWWQDGGHRHRSALFWYRTAGVALHRGVSVTVEERPGVPGDVIEYWPGVSRVDGEVMSDDYRAALDKLLEQMATEARDALAGLSTLVVVTGRR